MRRKLAHIVTVGNLFCGFLSIVMAIGGHGVLAAWLIITAALLDAFDGKIARFTRSTSDFGLQFDSMADLVSFGVAPGVLIYLLAFQEHGVLGVMVSFIPVLFSATRLARFNLGGRGESDEFEGLASPMHACLVASFMIFNRSLWGEVRSDTVLAGLVIFTGLLMVTRLPLPSLPRITFKEPGYNLTKLLVLVGCIALVAMNPPRHAFPVLASLVLSAFIVGAVRAAHRESIGFEESDTPVHESKAHISGGADDS